MKKIFTVLSLVCVASLSGLAQRPEGGPPMMPVQIALDANSDRVISGDEIANAPAALRKLDKNGDGNLTEEEVRPNFDRRGEGGGNENGTASIVNNLMEFDKNKDGNLSKQEIPERMQGIFVRGDANKDGILTKEELQKMAAAQATPAENSRGGDDHGERGGEREGGPRGGGIMRMMPLLSALDANTDGTISSDEINNSAISLKKLDKNNDGQLTEDEVRPMGRGGRGGFGGSPEEMVKRMMEFDKNGDGKLSKEELPERMQEMMGNIDTDHDGFLSADEIKAMAQQRGGRPDGERPRQQ